MYNDKKSLHRQLGFTLVEVMVALLIFMMIALGLARGEIAVLSAQSGNLYRDEALRVAEDQLSQLKGAQFSTAGTADALLQSLWPASPVVDTGAVAITVKMRNGSTTFTRSTQITDITGGSVPLKRIDVTVGWTQGNSAALSPTGKNHQTSVSTIIARVD